MPSEAQGTGEPATEHHFRIGPAGWRRKFSAWLGDEQNLRELHLIELILTAVVLMWALGYMIGWSPPAALRFHLDAVFYLGVTSHVFNCVILVLMFSRRETQSDKLKVIFGLLLILSASVVHFGIERAYADVESLHRQGATSFWTRAVMLYLAAARNVVSFGFAAIGAGIVSSVLTRQGRDSTRYPESG